MSVRLKCRQRTEHRGRGQRTEMWDYEEKFPN